MSVAKEIFRDAVRTFWISCLIGLVLMTIVFGAIAIFQPPFAVGMTLAMLVGAAALVTGGVLAGRRGARHRRQRLEGMDR